MQPQFDPGNSIPGLCDLQCITAKSSLDFSIYLRHKKTEYERDHIYLLFYFFFYKNKQFKKQKHIFSWLYKLQNSMTLVTLAFTLLLSLKANSLDTPCL